MPELCFWLRSQPETVVSIASANKLSFQFSSSPQNQRKAEDGNLPHSTQGKKEGRCLFLVQIFLFPSNIPLAEIKIKKLWRCSYATDTDTANKGLRRWITSSGARITRNSNIWEKMPCWLHPFCHVISFKHYILELKRKMFPLVLLHWHSVSNAPLASHNLHLLLLKYEKKIGHAYDIS